MKLSVKVFRTHQEFQQMKDVWKILEQKSGHGNLCSSYDWLFTWWSVFHKVESNEFGYRKELVLVFLYNNESLVAILPLLKLFRKKAGIKISFLEFLGQQWGGSFLDIIAGNLSKAEFDYIFEWINENLKYDIIFLKYIPRESPFFQKEKMYIYHACPEINLRTYNSFEDYKNKVYSKNLKQNIRTAFNRMEKNQNVLEESIEEISEKNFSEIIEVSRSKLKDNKSWVYGNRDKLEFYQNIYRLMKSNAAILKINGKMAAYRTNIIFNNRKFCIDASYDRDFNRYELGSISVDLNIRDSFEKGLVSESMGPGLDPYKFKFTSNLAYINIFLKQGNTFASFIIYPVLRFFVKQKQKAFLRELNQIKI